MRTTGPVLPALTAGQMRGGGLVAARHLAYRGIDVQVVLARDNPRVPAVDRQLDILHRMDVRILAEPRPHEGE